jgi:hypothetical protein
MNKLMIALGLLLIAGLSFAFAPGPWQYDWQNHVSWRYNCNLGPMGYGFYSAAATYMQPYADAGDFYSMNQYLGIMSRGLWGDLLGPGMANEYYVAPFRSDMAGYNSGNAAFRSIFNAAYREYMAATGDPGGNVRNYLAVNRAAYMECVADGTWPVMEVE